MDFQLFYCAIFDRKQKWTFTRYVVSYLIGTFLAYLFWLIFIRSLSLSLDITYILLIGLMFALGLGFVCTTAIKCITFLSFVGLLGKTGRGFLRALCVAFIISGPVANLAINGQEVVRVFACTTMVTYNLTKTRFDLMTKPIQNTLVAMKFGVTEIQNIFGTIEDISQPIIDEVEGELLESKTKEQTLTKVERLIRGNILAMMPSTDPSKATDIIVKGESYRNKYSQKMRKRCKEQLKNGENRCIEAFSNAHVKCLEALPAVVDIFLCWPLRIDYICNMEIIGYSETGGICDPSKAMDQKLDYDMLNLSDMGNILLRNTSEINFFYDFAEVEQAPQLKVAKETAKVVLKQCEKKKKMIDFVLTVMQRVLSFIFIKVIHSSVNYHKNYLTKIGYDNIYITQYFKKIDQRRKHNYRHTLLPLKKFERNILTDIDSYHQKTTEESRTTAFYLLQFAMEILISAFFLLLDHMVVVSLGIIAVKSEVRYYQEGEHKIFVHINGTGLLTRLIKQTFKNLNMHERISTFLSNDHCLPKPSTLSARFYLTLLGTYLIGLLIICYGTLTMRLRRYISSFFYQKQEKKRILHLYNKMLKQRISFLDSMLHKVREDLENRRLSTKLNLLLAPDMLRLAAMV